MALSKKKLYSRPKVIAYGVLALAVLAGILLLGKYHEQRKYAENDFGAYFQFDNFQLTTDEVIVREKELYNELSYQTIEVAQVGKSLKFPEVPDENEEYRVYRFHEKYVRLISMKACSRQPYIQTFTEAFKHPHEGRLGVTYWYGHIGSDQAILMAYPTALSMEVYEIEIITEDYDFPFEVQ